MDLKEQMLLAVNEEKNCGSMKLHYKTKTETGDIEIIKTCGITTPFNIIIKDKLIKHVKLVNIKNILHLSVMAWQVVDVFPITKKFKKTQEIQIKILDLNNNEIKAYNLGNVDHGDIEFNMKNLTEKSKPIKHIKNNSNDVGNFGTGSTTTRSKASKYGYDSIEH